jgi:hypothetical protein
MTHMKLIFLLMMGASAARAMAPQDATGSFAVAYGGSAYAIITDAAAVSGRIIVRRLGFDGGIVWEDRWGEGHSESPVGAAVTAWGGVSIAADADNGCVVTHYTSRGIRLWTNSLQYGSDCHSRAVLVDASGNTYVLGTTTAGSVFDATVWKIDRRGTVLWNYRPTGPNSRYAFAIDLASASDGVNVTTAVNGPAGWVYDSFDLDASGRLR